MAEKKFKGAPFGTQVARFDVSAVHPANKRVGTFTEISYCKRWTRDLERNLGPGSYNTDRGDFGVRAVAERAKGPGWSRAHETAKLAQIPHLLYREAWENKHFLKVKLGPGTYKTTDFIQELEKKQGSLLGVCESLEERFKQTQSITPGPGCYGKGGVPWAALEEKRAQLMGPVNMKKSAGHKRFPEGIADCGLSPCAYTLRNSIDALLSSSTSKRGPYDLFTGRRDKPVVAGYFAAQKGQNLTPSEYNGNAFGDNLCRKEKRKHGLFATLDRFPDSPTERISRRTPPQSPRPACPVGPGRYDIAAKGHNRHVNGHTSAFQSQTQRYLSHPHKDLHRQ
ncbi:ciliary microtubule-associated protein 2-like [Aplochiton taeniatus]